MKLAQASSKEETSMRGLVSISCTFILSIATLCSASASTRLKRPRPSLDKAKEILSQRQRREQQASLLLQESRIQIIASLANPAKPTQTSAKQSIGFYAAGGKKIAQAALILANVYRAEAAEASAKGDLSRASEFISHAEEAVNRVREVKKMIRTMRRVDLSRLPVE
jgi:hypothetical protein